MHTAEQVIEEVAIPMTYSLINEIEDAFHCPPALAGFSTFNLSNVPNSVADLQNYGKVTVYNINRS